MTSFRGILTGLLLVIMGIIPSIAYSDNALISDTFGSEGIKTGPMTLHFGLLVREMSDSNVYSDPKNEKKDTVSILSPAVALDVTTKRNSLKLGYSADIHAYSNYEKENFTQSTAKLNYTLKSLSGFEFSLGDTYLRTTDPRPEQNIAKRAEHADNEITAKFKYVFDSRKLTMVLGYQRKNLKYADKANDNLNRVDRTVNAALYHRFLPKTSMLFEYEFGYKEYVDSIKQSEDADSKKATVYLGLKWEPTAKMNGEIKGGFQKRMPVNDYTTIGATKYYFSEDAIFVASGNAEYKFTDTTGLKLMLKRSIEETTYSGSVKYSPASFYRANQIGLGLHVKIVSKVDVNFDVSYQSDSYQALDKTRAVRDDRTRNVKLKVDYLVNKRFATGFSIDYKNKDSEDSNNDEKRTKAAIRLRMLI